MAKFLLITFQPSQISLKIKKQTSLFRRFLTGSLLHGAGKEMVGFIANYLQNIRSRRVFPDVSPGYMSSLIPDTAPNDPEPWQKIFDDIETVIMPGVSYVYVKPLSGVGYVSLKRSKSNHKQWLNTVLFYAGRQSVVWPKLSFVWLSTSYRNFY